MTINKTTKDGKVVLSLEGKLDTASASDLQEKLLPAFDATGHVVLDLAKLSYVSSSGLRVLFFGQKTSKEKNGTMRIINVSENIKEVFDMTGFSEILELE